MVRKHLDFVVGYGALQKILIICSMDRKALFYPRTSESLNLATLQSYFHVFATHMFFVRVAKIKMTIILLASIIIIIINCLKVIIKPMPSGSRGYI